MKTFYCNVDTPSTRKILYVDDIKTVGRPNHEAQTLADFQRLIAEHQVVAVMFGFYSWPRKAVDVGNPKLDGHFRKLIRAWNKAAG